MSKTLKEKIEVMQAALDGKEIQSCNISLSNEKNSWLDATSPAWNWYLCDYRIKPEPRVFYATLDEEGETIAGISRYKDALSYGEIIKLQEVLE